MYCFLIVYLFIINHSLQIDAEAHTPDVPIATNLLSTFGRNKIEYNERSDLCATFMQEHDTFQIVLRDVIRKYLFPKVKFVHKTTDLMFNLSKKSICGVVLQCMNLNDISTDAKAKIWLNNVDSVAQHIQFHRNNVIKRIKTVAESK